MRQEELLNFNARGLIPGPCETEEQFLNRVGALYDFFSDPPPEMDNFLTESDWKEARAKTKALFDFAIDWAVAYYSNKRLPFFQGGATWLFQRRGLPVPAIQLKARLEEKRLYFTYQKEEILAHEAVHAARSAFNDPKFEEILAYKTAPSPLRRRLGPLFQKPWESLFFLFLLFSSFALQIWRGDLFFLAAPWLYFAFLCGRLFILHRRLEECLRRLKAPLAAALRLTDREILFFAKATDSERKAYIAAQQELRWIILKRAYNLR